MPLTDRELWLLNFYRNSELHGALLMGRLARSLSGMAVLANVTRHCATEAHHAELLTDLIAELGEKLDPQLETIQEYYSREGGVPTELVDVLVLSDVLEHRVLVSYREHLNASGIDPRVRKVLEQILKEEEEHGRPGTPAHAQRRSILSRATGEPFDVSVRPRPPALAAGEAPRLVPLCRRGGPRGQPARVGRPGPAHSVAGAAWLTW